MEIVARIGDVCAEDHGGGAIVKDDGGYYLEWTHGLECDHPEEDRYGDDVGDLMMEVFRVDLDEPAWTALCGHGDAADLWDEVASACDMDKVEMMHLATGKEPPQVAVALEMYASVWGWRNLDHDPMSITYRELESRWEGKKADQG